nr:immunoglobulin light chain junction region [Macaca mulatta]
DYYCQVWDSSRYYAIF